MTESEKLASINIEFFNSIEGAANTAKRQIADLYNSKTAQTQPVKKEPAVVSELNFSTLKFEPQQGVKLGQYEIAYKACNLEDKWRPAYNILRNNNVTIKERYHGEGYQYSYWLYGEDKIYRQKLKPKT